MLWRAEKATRTDWAPTVRFSPADRRLLEEAAAEAGVTTARLIREAAVRYARNVAAEIRAVKEREAAAPAPGRGPDKARQPAAATAAYQLDRVLATRSGMPMALMRRAREASRVTVGGVIHRDELVTAAEIERGLALDGIAV